MNYSQELFESVNARDGSFASDSRVYEHLKRLTRTIMVQKYSDIIEQDSEEIIHDISQELMEKVCLGKEIHNWDSYIASTVRYKMSEYFSAKYAHEIVLSPDIDSLIGIALSKEHHTIQMTGPEDLCDVVNKIDRCLREISKLLDTVPYVGQRRVKAISNIIKATSGSSYVTTSRPEERLVRVYSVLIFKLLNSLVGEVDLSDIAEVPIS